MYDKAIHIRHPASYGADISVMNNVLQIAFDNVNQGLSAATAGDLDIAQMKINEVCDILIKTTSLFNAALKKRRAGQH